MSSTTFTSGTVIASTWLNDVNNAVYNTVPAQSSATGISYNEGGTGAVTTTVQAKLQETVSVLDFGADPTGATDSSAAFTAAFAASLSVTIPSGTYSLSNVAVPSFLTLKGAGKGSVTLNASVNNLPIFDASAGVYSATLSGFTAGVKSGVTGAFFWRSTNYNNYSAYCSFSNIETRAEFAVSYKSNFIFMTMNNCRDGYIGTATTHAAMASLSGAANTTNLNQIRSCQFFGSNDLNGVISINVGEDWLFDSCDFEANSISPVAASGIFGLTFRNCWFEANTVSATYGIVNAFNSSTPSVQGSRPVLFDSCWINMNSNASGSYLISSTGSSAYTVINCVFTGAISGVQLSNDMSPFEFFGNNLASVPSSFLSGLTISRTNLSISNSQMTSGVINSPQTQNQNVLAIGPSGLGSTNFTNVSFTSIANAASAIGLTGQAVQFTLSGVAQAAYYSIASKLVTFLRGKTVTLIAMGYASVGGSGEIQRLKAWDSVSPTASNATTTSSGGIVVSSSGNTNLQLDYVTFTVGASATSLAVGFGAGGGASSQTVNIETMKLVLGTIVPDSVGF